MKTYRVWARMTCYAYLDVEAENKKDAISIAEQTDGGEFYTDDDPFSGSWEVIDEEDVVEEREA